MQEVIDLGPDIGVATLQPTSAETTEMYGILSDMESLRDIMLEFGVITEKQGEQLGKVSEHVESTAINTTDGNAELLDAYKYKHRQGYLRLMAIIGAGGLGTAGFLFNPVVGLGAMLAGGGVGWFLTRGKTVDTLVTRFSS